MTADTSETGRRIGAMTVEEAAGLIPFGSWSDKRAAAADAVSPNHFQQEVALAENCPASLIVEGTVYYEGASAAGKLICPLARCGYYGNPKTFVQETDMLDTVDNQVATLTGAVVREAREDWAVICKQNKPQA